MHSRKWGAAACVTFLLVCVSAHAGVIYEEEFDPAGLANGSWKSVEDVGWKAHYGANATRNINDGSPDASSNVNWLDGGVYIPHWGGADGNAGMLGNDNFGSATPHRQWIYWTDEGADGFTTFGDVSDLNSISFHERIEGSDDYSITHIVLQVNGDWYASPPYKSHTPDTYWWPHSVTFDGSDQFKSLTFDPGTELSLGSDTSLPASGDVTAIGLYNPQIDPRVRLDNVIVDGVVPEPSGALLLCLGLFLSGLGRRGKRNSRT